MRLRTFQGAALAALVTLVTPSVARAHGHLVRSRPAAGDTVRAAPRLLRLEFSEAPELALSRLRLVDAVGREVALSPLRIAGDSVRVMIADLVGPLQPGRYTVQWGITAADGHPSRGQYSFVFAPTAAPGTPAPATPAPGVSATAPPSMTPTTPASFDAASPLYAVVRWLQFASLLAVIGAVAFHYLVLPAAAREAGDAPLVALADDRARRLALGGAALLALSAAARLFAQWAVLRAAAFGGTPPSLDQIVSSTMWGRAWALEIGALALLGAGLLAARAGRRVPAGWALAAVAALALGVVPALSGHAAASGSIVAIAADALHVLVAGGWMGGLLVLMLAGLPAAAAVPAPRRAATLAALVNAFSASALVFVTVLVLTGLLAAWRNVESMSALVSSSYGRVLVLKLAMLGVAALAGLYNWRRARPALALTGDDRRIRASMRAELAAGVLIVAITAVLVAMPTPADLPMR